MGRNAAASVAGLLLFVSGCFEEEPSAASTSHSVFLAEVPPDLGPGYLAEVRAAFEAWARAGAGRFDYVPEDRTADISVQFIREWGGRTLGQHYLGLAQIGVGDSDCGRRWQPYTLDTVRAVAVHEIGHALGHDHSPDPASIMYEEYAAEYAFQLSERVNMPPRYTRFFTVCAHAANATFGFTVEADGPLNLYLVPGFAEYENIRQGKPFTHYPGCSQQAAEALAMSCTIDTRGGLVLDNRGDAEVNANMTIRYER